tara:strand:- start:261 stop:1379 length:1119 start_codon:yes stop_codon:yes gene_type:complete
MSTLKVGGIRGVSASSDAITVANDGSCTANITNNLSNRNILINGAAQVNQRGNLTSITSSTYCADRFRVAISAAGTWSISQSTDTPDGFSNSIKLDCTSAAASPGLMLIQQRIEGHNVQGFAKGTSTAKQFAVSFYVKTNKTGVYTVELKDSDNDRQNSKTITVSNTNWNRYTLIFPADTTGAFDGDANNSLQLSIWLAVTANSTYTNGTFSNGTWAATVNGNRVSNSNVNLADSTSNEFFLTGVQLEVGSVATDFEHRSFGHELALCQRYLFKNINEAGENGCNYAKAFSSTELMASVRFPVAMRSTPTVTTFSNTGNSGEVHKLGNPDKNVSSVDRLDVYGGMRINGTTGTWATGDTDMYSFTFQAEAEL